ncbi:MAG: heavy metal-responsive transcriptional regulator [Planctomycetes bacterium]|nr:heavy metal-responsive transcriptional regulator [Planctomycetota bacterium]
MRPDGESQMTIGRAAKSLDLPISTLRFYERAGLLVPSDRTPSGYRLYDQAAIARLVFIRSAQAVGFTLDDIRELLRFDEASSCKEVQDLLERRLADVRARLVDLNRVEDALEGALKKCRESRRGCGVLTGLRRNKAKNTAR